MNAQTNALADMITKARANALKAEREAATLEKIAAAWPENRPISFACDVGQFIAISAKVATRKGAAAYLEAFTLEPLAYVKGTFTSVKPREWFKPGEIEAAREAVDSDLMPAVWNFSNGKADLRAWPKLAEGVRVQLTIEIEADPARQVVEYDRPARNDRRIVSQELQGAPEGEAIRWASGNAATPYSASVWFYQEPGGGAPTLADLLARRGRVI